MGAIKIGERYLTEIEVESGYAGHSNMLRMPCTGVITSNEPYYFTASSIGNKVKSLIELMKYGDMEREDINIIMKK